MEKSLTLTSTGDSKGASQLTVTTAVIDEKGVSIPLRRGLGRKRFLHTLNSTFHVDLGSGSKTRTPRFRLSENNSELLRLSQRKDRTGNIDEDNECKPTGF